MNTEQPIPPPVVLSTALLNILPCPFCGHAPKLRNGKVKCSNLQCKVQPKIAAWYAPGYDDKAIADWNTRFNAEFIGLPKAGPLE